MNHVVKIRFQRSRKTMWLLFWGQLLVSNQIWKWYNHNKETEIKTFSYGINGFDWLVAGDSNKSVEFIDPTIDQSDKFVKHIDEGIGALTSLVLQNKEDKYRIKSDAVFYQIRKRFFPFSSCLNKIQLLKRYYHAKNTICSIFRGSNSEISHLIWVIQYES